MRESDSTEIENAMAAAISPDATDKEIRNLAIENSDKASRIYALTGDKSIYDYAVGSIKYSGYVDGSVTKNRRLEEEGGGPRGPEYISKQKKARKQFKDYSREEYLRNVSGSRIKQLQKAAVRIIIIRTAASYSLSDLIFQNRLTRNSLIQSKISRSPISGCSQ